MWDFLSSTMVNRAVILTTHSMEECEALCSRIGILVLGKLKCLGSAQHLKTKFGEGFQIDMAVADEARMVDVGAFARGTFPGAVEIEAFGGNVKYRIGKTLPLADVFARLEDVKTKLGITHYAISQTSLEQV